MESQLDFLVSKRKVTVGGNAREKAFGIMGGWRLFHRVSTIGKTRMKDRSEDGGAPTNNEITNEQLDNECFN